MAKTSSISFIFITALFAALPATIADSPQAAIKQFTPSLKARPAFNVYATPLSVAGSSSLVPSLASAAPNKDPAVSAKIDAAIAYLNKHHGIAVDSIKVTDAYIDEASGIAHVYAKQVVDGTEVANGLANVNIDRSNRVISSSQSFIPNAGKRRRAALASGGGSLVARAGVEQSLRTALKKLTDYVNTGISDAQLQSVVVAAQSSLASGEPGFVLGQVPADVAVRESVTAQQMLIQKSDGSVAPVWHMVLEQKDHWWSAHVNSQTGEVEAINDWVSRLEKYRVFPKDIISPEEGDRQLVTDPASTDASPKGWVADSTTTGNNVWAQNNPSGGYSWKNNYRPAASDKTFDYPLDLTKKPAKYVDAAITQLFYTVNVMHDLSFAYGFTEAAGNFQDVNYSGQGSGGDYVVAFAQDGSGTDNANFATPPDGQNGIMRMYTWTMTVPGRDGDLEQDIVAHEYTHGISNRLTGGASNTDCLYDGEAGGMGEGWSDTVANIMRIKPGSTSSTNMVLGNYVYQQNIRSYPYSTDMAANPQTYAYLDKPQYNEVHTIGEVWATILYEVVWSLIDATGGICDLYEKDLSKGNCLALQIILDAMKLQPCNPTFIQARDAIVQAEANLTGGKYQCQLWKAFAKRGMGPQASDSGGKHKEDYGVSGKC
ncbi:hypothetical protein LPJ56_000810 [Coemansia sp. RSA 2599]|nr:hypothetical protein LPJ75_000400 [Coemansia sp. RSA 2598]KAJ1828878.1 hypothetical protein LPJ56_000810 [Coemansia sp. RSA 2599]